MLAARGIMESERVKKYDGISVNLYLFSKEHPDFSLFVIKGTWYEATLYAAVEGNDPEDTDEALKISYTDKEYDVIEKYDLNLGKAGGFL